MTTTPTPIYEEYESRRPRARGDALTSEDQEIARIILTANEDQDDADGAFEQAASYRPKNVDFSDENDDPVLYGMGTEKGNHPNNIATTLGYGENPNTAASAELANRHYWGRDVAHGADITDDAIDAADDAIEEGALNTDAEDGVDDMMETAQVDNYSLDTFEDGLAEEDVDLLAGSEKKPELDFVKKLNKPKPKYKYTQKPGRKYPSRERNLSAIDRLFEKLKSRNEKIREKTKAGSQDPAEAQQEPPTASGDPLGEPPVIDPTSGLVVPGTGRQAPPNGDDDDENLEGFGADDEPETAEARGEPGADGDGDDDIEFTDPGNRVANIGGQPTWIPPRGSAQARGPINLDNLPDEEESREKVKGDLGLDPDTGDPGAVDPRNLKDILGRRGRRRRDRRKEKKGRGALVR